MYQNYIFDLYGTLVDIHTEEENSMIWEKLALFYGYYGAYYQPMELKETYIQFVQEAEKTCNIRYAYEGNPEIQIEKIFERLFTEKKIFSVNGLAVYAGQFFRVLTTEHIFLYKGVIEMLQKLTEKKKKIYLLSNAQRIFTLYELKMLNIIDYFHGIMISSDYGMKKPDLQFFHILIDQYHLDVKKSIMIGNDKNCDIAGAKKAGLDTYYIHSNLSPEDTETMDASYVQMEMDISKLCETLGI